jgi:hypothetical protein
MRGYHPPSTVHGLAEPETAASGPARCAIAQPEPTPQPQLNRPGPAHQARSIPTQPPRPWARPVPRRLASRCGTTHASGQPWRQDASRHGPRGPRHSRQTRRSGVTPGPGPRHVAPWPRRVSVRGMRACGVSVQRAAPGTWAEARQPSISRGWTSLRPTRLGRSVAVRVSLRWWGMRAEGGWGLVSTAALRLLSITIRDTPRPRPAAFWLLSAPLPPPGVF